MRTRNSIYIIILVLFLALGMAGSPAHAADFILGEGDLLKITVYQNEDLTTMARVSGDGMIEMPLIGKIKVGGLSVAEAEQRLDKMLGEGYLKEPHVTIFVEEYRSKRVTILGEVSKPGVYELNGNVSILEIISKAGGLTDKAGDNVLITRKKQLKGGETAESAKAAAAPGQNAAGNKAALPQQAEVYKTINLRELTESGDMAANLDVQDGDNIFVTKSGLIYVTGEVKRPGAYKYEEGTTVMKAIALAEGLTDKAAPGRTELIRKEKGGEKILKRVEMSFPVEADDVISVPESFF